MGLVYSDIELRNPVQGQLESMNVRMLVDSGSVHLCLPEHIALQLGLKELQKREVTYADGRKALVSYRGPVELRFGNRICFTGAMILGDEPLLGAIPMEDMDLVIHPQSRTLSVNPLNPNFAASVAKSFSYSPRSV